MRIMVRAIGFDLPLSSQERVMRRVHLALGRFADRLGTITVRLSDVNGPRGGEDKRCQVNVTLRDAREVIIDELHADLHAAIDVALGRAAHAVGRSLDRAAAVNG
jgi:putative sigma-54 modulation protein